MDEALPSVEITKRFLALCQQYGSRHAVVRLVAEARKAGVSGLPQDDDWAAWNANEMRAAVHYVEGERARAARDLCEPA